MGSSLDRRDHRYPIRLSVRLHNRGSSYYLVTGDVSYRGIFLCMDKPPQLRHLERIEVTLPHDPTELGAEGPLLVDGMVANVVLPGNPEGRPPGAGIEFYGFSGAQRARWERFIRKVADESPRGEQPSPKPLTLDVELEPVRAEPPPSEQGEEDAPPSVQDISQGGMFIRTATAVPVGAGLVVRLLRSGDAGGFAIDCVVRNRIFGSNAGIDVEFLEMTPARRNQLIDFLRPVALVVDGAS